MRGWCEAEWADLGGGEREAEEVEVLFRVLLGLDRVGARAHLTTTEVIRAI